MSLAEQANLITELQLHDKLSPGMKKPITAVKTLNFQTAKLKSGLSDTAKRVKHLGFLLGGALLAGGAVALKWASNFQAGLRTINTVAMVSDANLAKIGDRILSLSSKTGTALEDLQKGYYDIVSAGIKAADAQGILEKANTLAIGGLSTTGEAVDLLTTALNAYGLKASAAGRITDGFAQAVAAGKTTAAEIAQSFSRVAGVAASAGIGIDELQAAYANMTAKGVPAAEVATDVRAAIIALQKPTDKLRLLQTKLGVNFEEMAKNKGLAYAYDVIGRAARDAGIPMIQLTGRLEGTQFAAYNAGKAYKGYVRNLDAVHHSSDGAGVAAKQAAERQKGFDASIRRLRATAKDAGITLTTALLPAITNITDAIGKLINKHRGDLKRFGKSLGKMADDVFTPANVESGLQKVIKFVTSDDVKNSLKFAAEKSAAIINVFNGLDPQIKQWLLLLYAANKVTGGAVTAGLKGLIGLGLSSLKTITAANVTVIGANVTTASGPGVLPTGPAATPAGPLGVKGLLGSVLSAAGKLVLVAAVADIIVSAVALAEPAKDSARDQKRGQDSMAVKRLMGTGLTREQAEARLRGGGGPSGGGHLAGRYGSLSRSGSLNKPDLVDVLHNAMTAPLDRLTAAIKVGAVKDATQLAFLPKIADTSSKQVPALTAIQREQYRTRYAIQHRDLSVTVQNNISVREVVGGMTRVVSGHRFIE